MTSPRETGWVLVALEPVCDELFVVVAGVLPIVFGVFFLLSLPLNTVSTRISTTSATPSTPPTIISVVRSGDSPSSSATAGALTGGRSG